MIVSQKYQELCLISKKILIGFLFLEKQIANILDRGFLFLHNTHLLYSLSPYRRTESQTEIRIHSLCVGWRNLFSSCAVVSVFCSGRTQVLVLHTTYVLRVPYSCGVVLVFLVVAGISIWCYIRTQCTRQLCGGKVNFVQIFLLNPNFLLLHKSFSKILRFSTALQSQLFRKKYRELSIQVENCE